jgi:hypothetical protein
VDRSRGDGCFTFRDCNLVQATDDVSCGEKPGDRRFLVLIDL